MDLKSYTEYIRNSRVNMVHDSNLKNAVEFLAVSNAFGGEAGELQNVVKKIVRDGVFYEGGSELYAQFVFEAGDALHYLISLITLAGYEVDYIMDCNKKKLDERKRAYEAQKGVSVTSPSFEPRS